MTRPLVLAALALTACVRLDSPGHRGPPGAHFDGERFHNQAPVPEAGLPRFLRWQSTRRPGPWTDDAEAPPGPPPPRRVADGRLRVTWINHATALVQMDGVNVLTDPIWSDRCSPVGWAGPERARPPGLRFEDLPPIDLVLISHNHYDHLDLPTLRRLAARDRPVILAGLGTRALLEAEGVPRSADLDWWQGADHGPLRITAVPAQHFSGRGLGDRDRTLWAGFVVQGPAGTVYFAGDTGWGPHFAQIAARFGPPRLALLPIGAYRPRWFMAPMHIDPEEAVRAHRLLGARTSVGIHWGTFPLADDGQHEPLRDLALARSRHGVPPTAFRALGFGEGVDLP